MVAQFLNDPDPPALFLMDSLGSLIEDIADFEIFNTTLKDRLVILDPPIRITFPGSTSSM